MAATIAMTMNIIVQRNIEINLSVKEYLLSVNYNEKSCHDHVSERIPVC